MRKLIQRKLIETVKDFGEVLAHPVELNLIFIFEPIVGNLHGFLGPALACSRETHEHESNIGPVWPVATM